MSQHTDQVASVIRRNVQEILSRGLNDPRVRGLVSITEVRVTDDLAEARIAVSVLPEQHAALTLRGLHSAASHIRAQLGRSASLRRLPQLTFRLDSTLKKQARVLDAIRRAAHNVPHSDIDPPASTPSHVETNKSTQPPHRISEDDEL